MKPSKEDSTLAEFLDVMKPRNKKDRSWANDPDPNVASTSASATPTTAVEPVQDPSSSTSKSKSMAKSKQRVDDDTPMDDAAAPAADTNDEAVSDLEWMRRRMASSALETATPTPSSSNPEPTIAASDQIESTAPLPGESIEDLLAESPRLYLRNLAYSCTTADLEEAFGKFGHVEQVRSLPPLSLCTLR